MKKAAGKLRRGSYSRPAKKGEVDDLLNSEAFLKKKVQMLEKQIKATHDEIKGAEEEAQKAWDEWGPQVQRAYMNPTNYGLKRSLGEFEPFVTFVLKQTLLRHLLISVELMSILSSSEEHVLVIFETDNRKPFPGTKHCTSLN